MHFNNNLVVAFLRQVRKYILHYTKLAFEFLLYLQRYTITKLRISNNSLSLFLGLKIINYYFRNMYKLFTVAPMLHKIILKINLLQLQDVIARII